MNVRVLLFILFFACSSFSQTPISASVENGDNAKNGIYTETYPSPFFSGSISFMRFFSRLDEDKLNHKTNYLFSLEQYTERSIDSTALDVSVRNEHSRQLFSLLSFRRERINSSRNANWVGRAGLIYSMFKNRENAFFDTYWESFVRLPENEIVSASIGGWIKIGYRYAVQSYWNIDPLILMARVYDNTNTTLLGADNVSLNIGPQLSYFSRNKNISGNIIAARSFVTSRTLPIINNYWALLTLGMYF